MKYLGLRYEFESGGAAMYSDTANLESTGGRHNGWCRRPGKICTFYSSRIAKNTQFLNLNLFINALPGSSKNIQSNDIQQTMEYQEITLFTNWTWQIYQNCFFLMVLRQQIR